MNTGQLSTQAGIKSKDSSFKIANAPEIITLSQKPEHSGQLNSSPKNKLLSSSHNCQSSQVNTSSSFFRINMALDICRGRCVLNHIVRAPHVINAPRI